MATDTCPDCNGQGMMTFTMLTTDDVMTMSCFTCNATGVVTAKQKLVLDRERAMWCVCPVRSGQYYVDNYKHPELSKHHWRCCACHKVTQVG